MIEYLKELLFDIEKSLNGHHGIVIVNNEKVKRLHQKKLALETAIEILEKLRNDERSLENGNQE